MLLIALALIVAQIALLAGIFTRLDRIGGRPRGWLAASCPHCFELVDKRATACPHCTRDIERKPT